MKVRDVMTGNIQLIDQGASLVDAAKEMKRIDVGSLPVTDGEELVGILTDRDIVVRSIAEEKNPEDIAVKDIMSAGVDWISTEATVDQAIGEMEQKKVRRLPVRDENKRIVGIVSLGDLAVKGDREQAAEALEEISKPAEPDRPGS